VSEFGCAPLCDARSTKKERSAWEEAARMYPPFAKISLIYLQIKNALP